MTKIFFSIYEYKKKSNLLVTLADVLLSNVHTRLHTTKRTFRLVKYYVRTDFTPPPHSFPRFKVVQRFVEPLLVSSSGDPYVINEWPLTVFFFSAFDQLSSSRGQLFPRTWTYSSRIHPMYIHINVSVCVCVIWPHVLVVQQRSDNNLPSRGLYRKPGEDVVEWSRRTGRSRFPGQNEKHKRKTLHWNTVVVRGKCLEKAFSAKSDAQSGLRYPIRS